MSDEHERILQICFTPRKRMRERERLLIVTRKTKEEEEKTGEEAAQGIRSERLGGFLMCTYRAPSRLGA
jgi:hypothetical protein